MICFYCGEEIVLSDIRFYAFEKPYVNIPVHRTECFRLIEGQGALKYFKDNSERVYEYRQSQADVIFKKKRGKNGT